MTFIFILHSFYLNCCVMEKELYPKRPVCEVFIECDQHGILRTLTIILNADYLKSISWIKSNFKYGRQSWKNSEVTELKTTILNLTDLFGNPIFGIFDSQSLKRVTKNHSIQILCAYKLNWISLLNALCSLINVFWLLTSPK